MATPHTAVTVWRLCFLLGSYRSWLVDWRLSILQHWCIGVSVTTYHCTQHAVYWIVESVLKEE